MLVLCIETRKKIYIFFFIETEQNIQKLDKLIKSIYKKCIREIKPFNVNGKNNK